MSQVQDREEVGDFTTATGWAVFGNDTVNLAAAVQSVLGTASLEFDKVDGAAGQKYAGASCTIASLDLSRFTIYDELVTCIGISSEADVDYAFIRMGTDVSHNNEWRFRDTLLTGGAEWTLLRKPLGECIIAGTGNGWDRSAIVYLAVGVMFDAETDALADIKFDHVHVVKEGGHLSTL